MNSPNLVLACASSSGGELLVKVTDFGLSKDKGLDEAKHTVLMTGCGSILWMAPEIMHAEQCATHTSRVSDRQMQSMFIDRCRFRCRVLDRNVPTQRERHEERAPPTAGLSVTASGAVHARRYNESVDVFSFAMTMVECIDGHLPWTGTCGAGGVPMRVTRGDRPLIQLQTATPSMRRLVVDCWSHEPSERPTFAKVVQRLERMEVTEARFGRVGSAAPVRRYGGRE